MTAAPREARRAALRLAMTALVAAGLLTGVQALTRERIAAAERQAQLQALAVVLPASRYDNDPLADAVLVQAPAWLGLQQATVRRARLGGRASALVIEASAPDGYSGPIHLLVTVDADGRVGAVRVTRHQETPGLGDAIEAEKGDWIAGFARRSLRDPAEPRWAVRKDGGDFDQLAGATVTPRAIVAAVRRCLTFVARHGDAIRSAQAGVTLRFDDAPERHAPGSATAIESNR